VRDGVILAGAIGGEEDVWVWVYGADGWTEQARLMGSDSEPGSEFGWSVAYDGERAAVGAPRGFAAYVYGPASLPVAAEPPVLPTTADAALSAPHPNPFRKHAVLTLQLDRPQFVEAALYDVLGRQVRLVHSGSLPVVEHRLNVEGGGLAPGLYILRVTGESFARSRRLVRLR
jgi:hypothetical protein